MCECLNRRVEMSKKAEGVPNKILINPNFNQTESQLKANVHINPKFQQKAAPDSSTAQNAPKVHINPNFAARPLPQVPGTETAKGKNQCYVNPSFLDLTKTKAYDESVKKVIENKKIFVNPKKFQAPPATPGSTAPRAMPELSSPESSSSEKENIMAAAVAVAAKTLSPKTSSMAASHSKKSLFKKIGARKLIRVRSSVSGKEQHHHLKHPSACVQKINSPVLTQYEKSKFKKIGSNKLVRVKSIGLVTTPPVNSPGRYKLKTKSKIVVKTPRSIFSTPFSLRRKRVQTFTASPSPKKAPTKSFGKRFSNVFSPFKVDRRPPSTPSVPPKLATVSEHLPSASRTAPAATIPKPTLANPMTSMLTDEKYKKPVPPKPVRKTPATTLINVQGVRYEVSDNGRKLNRLESKPTDTPKAIANESSEKQVPAEIIPRKLYLDGEEYIEDEPGVLIRSRNSMTRQSITSYKNRSINTIIKSQTRSKQYCMFFNKFGKCNKRDSGMCPYIHDPSKVAVCRKFLQANCHNEKCLLSHQVAPDKMPSCKFFLQGLCTRDPCPYRHVQVSADAKVCPDFLKGFCPAGNECKLKHFIEKSPEKKPSPKPEASVEVVMREKKVPPAKPKRKSLCQTPLAMSEKKARVRYYDERTASSQNEPEEGGFEQDDSEMDKPKSAQMSSPSYEQKRQRLLRKVELAKQGWTGMATAEFQKKDPARELEFLDDSGPYEEIPEDYLEKRPPIGRLPSFISLETSKTDEVDGNDDDVAQNDTRMEENSADDDKQEIFDERLI